MVFFPTPVLSLILEYCDDRIEAKQRKLHNKVLAVINEYGESCHQRYVNDFLDEYPYWHEDDNLFNTLLEEDDLYDKREDSYVVQFKVNFILDTYVKQDVLQMRLVWEYVNVAESNIRKAETDKIASQYTQAIWKQQTLPTMGLVWRDGLLVPVLA